MQLSQSQKSVVWIITAALVLGGAVLALILILDDKPGVAGVIDVRPRTTLQQEVQGDDGAANLPIEQFLPSEVLDLDAQDAMARNLALPISRGPNPSAPAFAAQWLGADLDKSIKCLATAVYYEASGEPMAGQRAVAQVVLNRLRNPHYPKTICEVVYQGAERPTGCQFSFACDGSTRHVPGAAGWAVANAVATSALNGVISGEAGQATHYHTLAVFPAWAPQLAKIGIIGHHVFYRPPGRSTFDYDMIVKAVPVDPTNAALAPNEAIVNAVPAAPPSSLSVPEVADTIQTGSARSPSNPDPVQDGSVIVRQAVPSTAARQVDPATPAVTPRRSMFPTRQARSPNLPLATDH